MALPVAVSTSIRYKPASVPTKSICTSGLVFGSSCVILVVPDISISFMALMAELASIKFEKNFNSNSYSANFIRSRNSAL